MLEKARALLHEIIEKYGVNDELTLSTSSLVDKILNKHREEGTEHINILNFSIGASLIIFATLFLHLYLKRN